MKAKMVNGVPHIAATDARRELAIVGDEILAQFDKVIVERAGKPWLVITLATEEEEGEVIVFGEE